MDIYRGLVKLMLTKSTSKLTYCNRAHNPFRLFLCQLQEEHFLPRVDRGIPDSYSVFRWFHCNVGSLPHCNWLSHEESHCIYNAGHSVWAYHTSGQIHTLKLVHGFHEQGWRQRAVSCNSIGGMQGKLTSTNVLAKLARCKHGLQVNSGTNHEICIPARPEVLRV